MKSIRAMLGMCVLTLLSAPAWGQLYADGYSVVTPVANGATATAVTVDGFGGAVYVDGNFVSSFLNEYDYQSYPTGYAHVDFIGTLDYADCDTFSLYGTHYVELDEMWYSLPNSFDSKNVCKQQQGGGGGGQIPGIGQINNWSVTDGDGGADFTVPITGGVPVSFLWRFDTSAYTPMAYNNANPGFSTPTQQSTHAVSHWYSYRSDPCFTGHSTYDIFADVTFDNAQKLTGSASLDVNIDGFGGATNPFSVQVLGMAGLVPLPNGWLISGQGGLYRTAPVVTYSGVRQGTQFWDKISNHEAAHVSHFIGGPFSDWQTVEGLLSYVDGTYYPDLGMAEAYVAYAKGLYFMAQYNAQAPAVTYEDRRKQSEDLAYRYSDLYPPHYGGFEWVCHVGKDF